MEAYEPANELDGFIHFGRLTGRLGFITLVLSRAASRAPVPSGGFPPCASPAGLLR